MSAGIDLNTQHLMASQSASSSAHTKGPGYTGVESSGFSHVPEHVTKAKENETCKLRWATILFYFILNHQWLRGKACNKMSVICGCMRL